MADAQSDFTTEWVGKHVTYTRGGPGDRRYPEPTTYEGTVKAVLWPGSIISNEDGRWKAFRFRIRTDEGKQVTTAAMPSPIRLGEAQTNG